MNNIIEYIKWRGEIPFPQVACNEVDAYILAKIGVPELDGILSLDGPGAPLDEVYAAYFGRKDIDPDYFGRLNQPILAETLRMLPNTGRFGKLLLSDYLEKINNAMVEQISALTISIPEGPVVVSFRGTDDTIVGWQENFMMAVQNTVPAQQDALEYLIRIADRYRGPIIVVGHSKGGNLAVYASVMAPEEIQSRISGVYNFDGPGFRREFWKQPGLERVQDRIYNYVSQHTMVGTLMTESENLIICRSRKSGPLAHEAMFWEVMGPCFIREEKLSEWSRKFDRLMDRQMEQLTDEELSRFVNDFFGILTSTGATTITELTRQTPEQFYTILKEINNTESVKSFGKELIELLIHDKRRLTDVLKQFRINRRPEPQ